MAGRTFGGKRHLYKILLVEPNLEDASVIQEPLIHPDGVSTVVTHERDADSALE